MPSNPIDPFQPNASFGSPNAEAPGRLRQNGYTQQFVGLLDTPDSDSQQVIPFMSGTGGTDGGAGYNSLPGLAEGEQVSIFGITAVGAGGGATPMVFGLMASGHNLASSLLLAGSANKNGPWFQNFEIPLQVAGPARVWIQAIDTGAGASDTYNYVALSYIKTDANASVIT